jgi:hypothetical protein
MAIQFQRLITPGEGVSTLMDFAPLAGAVNDGITGYYDNKRRTAIGAAAQQGNAAAAQEALKQGELDTGAQYQRLAQQDTDRATQAKDRQVKMLGGIAQAAKFEKDPARRALLWNTGLKRAGVNPADLDPDELDPMTGPDVFLAASGMAQDPRESQLMDLKIAQANKTLAAPIGGTQDKTALIQNFQFRNSLKTEDERKQFDDLVRRQNILAGDTLLDSRTGAPVANVGDALARGEAAKAEGKGAAETKMALPKARASLRALETQHRNVKTTIERAMPKINAWTAGLAGQTLGSLGSTDANDLRTLLNTVKANLGFDKLQDMRDNSPTGGALGQVAVAELEMLQSAFASVEQSQTPEQLRENMTYLNSLISEMQDNRRMAFDDTYGEQNRPQPSNTRAVPPQAADVLRRDPSPDAVREFNEVFGQGAAESVLNGR